MARLMTIDSAHPLMHGTYLVVSRDEMAELVNESGSARDFVVAANRVAKSVGYDAAARHSTYYMAGVPSVRLWLDGTPMDDLRNEPTVAHGKPPAGCSYLIRGRGYHVRIRNHATIG